MTVEEVERVLLEVGRMSLETVSTKTPVPIGVLTAGHRDDWYKGEFICKRVRSFFH